MKPLIKRLSVAIATLTIVILLSPGMLYVALIASIPAFPVAPVAQTNNVTEWFARGGSGLPYSLKGNEKMELESVNPWQYAWHTLVRCKFGGGGSAAIHKCVYYYRGHMAAFSAAHKFLHAERPDDSLVLRDLLQSEALMIWIARNWTADQLAGFLELQSPRRSK